MTVYDNHHHTTILISICISFLYILVKKRDTLVQSLFKQSNFTAMISGIYSPELIYEPIEAFTLSK